jgi:predicted unusual protein kinase regulating ubiquinone biosynthesis (AarF/ABC1/UbiB family)
MAKDSIPTGRLRRTARIGGLAGGTAARSYAARAADLTRSEQKRQEAAERRQVQMAERILDVLGQMKGAAMKIGQVASFVDSGALPPEVHRRLEEKLAELRDSAPRVEFDQMRKVLESDLEQRLDDVFAEFETEAFAAASIGQVYRARLKDGRRVAVKVQYPGIARAVRADLQNLGLILRVAKMMAPGMDPKAMAEEIRERLTEELDYELEAQTHRAFARTWRGHPFVVIPEVVTSLSSEHVLVTEYVEGLGFEQVKELPQSERDRFGEIVFRFCFGSIYHLQHFNADAHPGNYLLLPDGRVSFLDFGMTKHLDQDQIELEIAALEAIFDDHPERLRVALHDLGFLNDPRKVDAELLMDHVRAVGGWYMEDREVTIDSSRVMQAIAAVSDPRSDFYRVMRRENLPANELMGRRMESGVLAVLGQLGATRNWYRIGREWWFGEPPATELGELERAWVERSGSSG